ncbi:hypothetical protein CDD83_10426 [Cordyceps sp. RAO-2017]|nr:hypothetical protein CDD83_10426 [Cordyceps sp. RAO-2017]
MLTLAARFFSKYIITSQAAQIKHSLAAGASAASVGVRMHRVDCRAAVISYLSKLSCLQQTSEALKVVQASHWAFGTISFGKFWGREPPWTRLSALQYGRCNEVLHILAEHLPAIDTNARPQNFRFVNP